jgi:SAM-dependent methyltransferase
MFGPDDAALYDLRARSRGRDCDAEARDVAHRIVRLHPAARSLLDVACGTGAHLQTFRRRFDHVEGLELAPAMRERAQRRLPGVTIHAGDMRAFGLGRAFDAVTVLGVGFAFLRTVAELRAAARRVADHLVPGGVVVVEPWWLPDRYVDHYVGSDLVRDGDRVLARVSHTERRDGAAHMEARWVVGDATGLRSFTTTDAFTLFARQDYEAALEGAGCTVSFEEPWLTGRGIFVGVRL